MWLYIIAVVLLVAGIIGGVVSGGIFTIIVLPLGVIILVAAFAAGMWSRSGGSSAHGDAAEVEPAPLPHTNRPQPGTRGTSSPDELVDARRQAQ
jgi:hypothetical protein